MEKGSKEELISMIKQLDRIDRTLSIKARLDYLEMIVHYVVFILQKAGIAKEHELDNVATVAALKSAIKRTDDPERLV